MDPAAVMGVNADTVSPELVDAPGLCLAAEALIQEARGRQRKRSGPGEGIGGQAQRIKGISILVDRLYSGYASGSRWAM